MEATQHSVWQQYPPIVLPSPVLALAAQRNGVWAAGAGGVAWYPIHSDWQTRSKGLPINAVVSLAYTDSILLAGGTGGIAYSFDGGVNWKAAAIPNEAVSITALLISPRFAEDKIAIAGTLEHGILRSEDGGETWRDATFGLQSFEITALVWGAGENILAGTTDGIYRSSNGGRAWRQTRGSEGEAVAALTFLSDGTALAALENGGLLSSRDGGARWNVFGELPEDVQGTALLVTPDNSLLLGTSAHGILRSTDNGTSWTTTHNENVLSFATDGKTLYAGTIKEIWVSVNDGVTWMSLPHPPIHDLRQILIYQDQPLLAGSYSGLLRYNGSNMWLPIPQTPQPLAAIALGPDEASLFASSPDGLFYSPNGGTDWQTLIEGEAGLVGHITFQSDGIGWAGSLDGARLLQSRDKGMTWQEIASPFGVLPLAALQSAGTFLMAATYDPRQYKIQFWRTLDEGKNWQRGAEADIAWPIVATWADPPALSLGAILLLERAGGAWHHSTVGNGNEPVRRIAATRSILFVLTTESLLYTTDEGVTWTQEQTNFTAGEIVDITIHKGQFYVLLAGGRVWSHSL